MLSWWHQWCSLLVGWWCSLACSHLQKKSVSTARNMEIFQIVCVCVHVLARVILLLSTVETAWNRSLNSGYSFNVCRVHVRSEFGVRDWTRPGGDGHRQPQASDEWRGGWGGSGGVWRTIPVGPAAGRTSGRASSSRQLLASFLSAWSAARKSAAPACQKKWPHVL